MEKGMDLYPTLANNYALVRQHGNSIIFPLGSENEGQYLTPQYEYVSNLHKNQGRDVRMNGIAVSSK